MRDSDRPTQPPPDDRTTMTQCLACDGHYSTERRTGRPGAFAYSICRWCTQGYMSREQAIRWSKHVRGLAMPEKP